jgi:triacylglycerol lipase
MSLELNLDDVADPKNAAALACACQLAYFPADIGAASFQTDLGMAARLVSVDNTQAYLATNDKHVVVAFRGSESPASLDGLKDWLLTNALNLLVPPEGKLSTEFLAAGVGAKFHQGFVLAITEVWDALFPLVEAEVKAKDRGLWVTGHSLGGALALLSAWLFKRKFLPVDAVYTFGAPMVGNKQVAEAFGREFPGKIFRYVNATDPVPLLPMMSLIANDFAHCDTLVTLGGAEAAADLLAFLRSATGEVVGGVLSGEVTERAWGAVKGKVDAHLIPDYRKHLG